MVVIKKVLNSSVVLVEDERNVELILLGKGVGFGKKRGDIINNIDEMQTFIPIQSERDKQFVEVISEIPYELLDITKEIGNRVTSIVYNGKELDEDTTLTLVMNNYRASGAGGYEFYTDCKVVKEVLIEMPDLIIDYFKNNKNVIVDKSKYLTIVS